MVTIVDNTIKLKFSKSVELKCSHTQKTDKYVSEGCLNQMGGSFQNIYVYQIAHSIYFKNLTIYLLIIFQ